MTNDRKQVIMDVFEGRLPVENITMEELQQLEEAVFNAIAAKSTPFETWETLQ